VLGFAAPALQVVSNYRRSKSQMSLQHAEIAQHHQEVAARAAAAEQERWLAQAPRLRSPSPGQASAGGGPRPVGPESPSR